MFAKEGNLTMIKMSLDNSKTPVDCPHTGIHGFDRTALHLACAHGRLNAAKYLINEKKAGINIQDRDGNTPLHLATMNNSVLVANMLLEMKCDPMKRNVKGETALKIALKMEHYDIVFLIREVTGIRAGDGSDEKEEVHASLKVKTIWDAARYGDLDTLKQKLNANVIGINDSNELKFGQKRKLLHIASATGKVHVVKYLLSNGADVNAVDSFKRTPLFFAARNDEYEILKILLAAGADSSMTDKSGSVASDFARSQKHFRCSALLDGNSPRASNSNGDGGAKNSVTIDKTSPKATPSKVQLKNLSDDNDMGKKVNESTDDNNGVVTEMKDDSGEKKHVDEESA
jgi:ankyrin repeat protein